MGTSQSLPGGKGEARTKRHGDRCLSKLTGKEEGKDVVTCLKMWSRKSVLGCNSELR